MTTYDDLLLEIARRETPPHWLAAAAGVSRRALEAAIDGDPQAMSGAELSRVGTVLGLGSRVLEVPAGETPDRERVLEAARRLVDHDERSRVHDPDAAWARAAADAGVDVASAYGMTRRAA